MCRWAISINNAQCWRLRRRAERIVSNLAALRRAQFSLTSALRAAASASQGRCSLATGLRAISRLFRSASMMSATGA